jgi:hypothetical protein
VTPVPTPGSPGMILNAPPGAAPKKAPDGKAAAPKPAPPK